MEAYAINFAGCRESIAQHNTITNLSRLRKAEQIEKNSLPSYQIRSMPFSIKVGAKKYISVKINEILLL